jgi:hypothetical protein
VTPTPSPAGARPAVRRALAGLAIILLVGVGVAVAVLVGSSAGAASRPSPAPSAEPTPSATAVPATPPPTPVPTPLPTPEPTPTLVPAALTGRLVTEQVALQHPIAVMIDDHVGARPQSGLNAASIVWQAPAEGGIPRYMLIFQDQIPAKVGPVRSSREYFIEWAAEWNAMYVHAGGSFQALDTLVRHGNGQWVWNADEFRWEGTYLFRVHEVKVLGGPTYPLVRPHNVYTDGAHLRKLAARIGADDGPLTAAWTFGLGALPVERPTGTRITVAYPYEAIQYRYDPTTNTYFRYIKSPYGGAFQAQIDAADGKQVAPRNVVVLQMSFAPLLVNGHPDTHHRLEAKDVGHGVAWISTNGVTVKGTWRKASVTAPTLLFGPGGKPITLTAGQTFIQVMQRSDLVTIKPGTFRPPPAMKPLSLLPF